MLFPDAENTPIDDFHDYTHVPEFEKLITIFAFRASIREMADIIQYMQNCTSNMRNRNKEYYLEEIAKYDAIEIKQNLEKILERINRFC